MDEEKLLIDKNSLKKKKKEQPKAKSREEDRPFGSNSETLSLNGPNPSFGGNQYITVRILTASIHNSFSIY